MNYFEIKIECAPGCTEDAENFLVINDILNYFVTDSILEQEIMKDMPWLIKDELDLGNAFITICINNEIDAKNTFDLLKDKFDVTIRDASDSEWKDNWKAFAKIVRITDDLVIKPCWVEYEKKENERIVELDSGAAFGTGTHETTQICATLIEKYLSTKKEPSSMLDIGTGSGVLAIIGAIMGAKKIVATDIDPQACETAKINIEKNGYTDITEVRCGDLLEVVDGRYDIITANIIADVLLILLCDVKQLLNTNGVLIMSGVLEERCQEIIDFAISKGFTLIEKKVVNDWCGIVLGVQ
jgi:ribosomal protein L11 methyltransferase